MSTPTTVAFAIASALAATTLPAAAQESRTFAAWGHEFIRPEAGHPVGAPSTSRSGEGAVPLRSKGRGTAYTSSSERPPITASEAQTTATRTINVWGARIEVPAR
ncbi:MULTISPECIES: hypothetical protein [Methylobacteriaceae]|jgi:hypothetical protein|uniref:Uncharacterized protein n=2 Tax=Methylobacteriaceae TaxID=119045 RepID=A0A160PKC0_9HYPH|nr:MULTISPECIES: hypothetical protein [Methylobacteriaceae]MBY0297343.1 hypothetical protein [Methylobacterium sp.]MDN3627956.1 hypothetical protein [Methylobacterium isbiliense]QRE78279.1 hypothetical protein F1D61_33170 [Methylobacterium aquaticum]QRE78309.1 hypothetical protein F1D61_33360 [Methylobacterium aquaticum]BAU94097.1 hypothetical protein MPPM_5492 [Methylorubrum populi]